VPDPVDEAGEAEPSPGGARVPVRVRRRAAATAQIARAATTSTVWRKIAVHRCAWHC